MGTKGDAEIGDLSSTEHDAAPCVPEIVVVGLGPGNPKQITLEAWELLTAPGARVHVRTRQHPTLRGLPAHVHLTTFDHVYEATKRLEDVYPQIADELFEKAIAAATEADADNADAEVAAAVTKDGAATAIAVTPDADADAARQLQRQRRRVIYAVPGDPCVAENSVAILRAAAPARGGAPIKVKNASCVS